MDAITFLLSLALVLALGWIGFWRKAGYMKEAVNNQQYAVKDVDGKQLAIVDSKTYWSAVYETMSSPLLLDRQSKAVAVIWVRVAVKVLIVLTVAAILLYLYISSQEGNEWTYRTTDMMVDIVMQLTIMAASLFTLLSYNGKEAMQVYRTHINDAIKSQLNIQRETEIKVTRIKPQVNKSLEVK